MTLTLRTNDFDLENLCSPGAAQQPPGPKGSSCCWSPGPIFGLSDPRGAELVTPLKGPYREQGGGVEKHCFGVKCRPGFEPLFCY